MLTNYLPTQAQQQISTITGNINPLPYLTLSYNLENYYSLLSHIKQDSDPRWILFIAPPGRPNFTFLQQAGIPKSRIITLPASKISNPRELLKTTLKSGNYATVVTWLTECDQTLQNEINTLAEQTNSCCFVYCAQ
jgi:cell division inhibitor SulA